MQTSRHHVSIIGQLKKKSTVRYILLYQGFQFPRTVNLSFFDGSMSTDDIEMMTKENAQTRIFLNYSVVMMGYGFGYNSNTNM